MCSCDQLRKLVAQVRPVGRMSLEPWLTISHIKAHSKQCSEENAGKYDRNDDTRLHCSTSRGSAARDKRCQYEGTMGARCSRSAYTPLIRHSRLRCETGVNQALPTKRSCWKCLSSRDQWNLTPATMCRGSAARAVWSRHFGAAQTMHSHKCDHLKFLLAHSQKMSRALPRTCEFSTDLKHKICFILSCVFNKNCLFFPKTFIHSFQNV